LDAPDLVDDYYLNLISWSTDNILAVALGQSVYLWNASSGDIQHLVTLPGRQDYVTSVCWSTMPGQSKYLAIGTNNNAVQLWDSEALNRVRTLGGHCARVSSLAWNHQWLSSGGRDSIILQHDVRAASHVASRFKGHTQEVCGLKWNEDGTTLASGGNENFLCIWDVAVSRRNSDIPSDASSHFVQPRLLLTQHKAAVKALAWCPFRRDLLASGGGTSDRTIKFWNSNNGTILNSIDTGSQVCSLLWSKHQRELVSSHGFSENQLILWQYPTMSKVKEFKGHTSRVLNMEMGPDGQIVSAAADETLRFWDIFGPPPNRLVSKFGIGDFQAGLSTIR
jgi:cell division cycle protein 20 (cofactor of APC complex)